MSHNLSDDDTELDIIPRLSDLDMNSDSGGSDSEHDASSDHVHSPPQSPSSTPSADFVPKLSELDSNSNLDNDDGDSDEELLNAHPIKLFLLEGPSRPGSVVDRVRCPNTIHYKCTYMYYR